jgi:hypothetical protein
MVLPLNCQTELKSYMTAVAGTEIDVIDKNFQVVLFQALKGFSQLLLINKGVDARPATDADIREVALSTLEHNIKYFTKEHNFHFVAGSIFTNFKEATNDTQPPWLFGRARTNYVAEHAKDIGVITLLLPGTIISRWQEKVRECLAKKKATLLQNTQQAFFKTATTKDAAKALAAEKGMDETTMAGLCDLQQNCNRSKKVRASLTKVEEMIRCTKISTNAPQKPVEG